MDALNGILARLRVYAPVFSIIEMGGDLSIRSPGANGIAAFHYVIEGECRICQGGRDHRLTAGEFGIFPHWPDFAIETGAKVPAVPLLDILARHGLGARSPTAGRDAPVTLRIGTAPVTMRLLSGVFSLDGAEADLLEGLNRDFLRFGPKDAPLQGWLRACLDFVIHESAEPRPGFAAVAGRALELLLADTLRGWVYSNQLAGWARGLAEPHLRRALNALHDQPSRTWTLRDLAQIAGQSRSRFAASFAAVVGETPIAYLTRWRMYLAAHRLADGSEPIAVIAEAMGYAGSFAFGRAFRQHYGISPGTYRKAARRDGALAAQTRTVPTAIRSPAPGGRSDRG